MADSTLSEDLVKAARVVDAARDVETALSAITQSAVISLPGIEHAGISVMRSERAIETRGATSELPRRLDDLQFELAEGPCFDAMLPGAEDLQVSNDVRHDQRWPRYVPRAVELGLKAQLGVKLFSSDLVFGALNLYSTENETIPDETLDGARLFAAHAATVLGRVVLEKNLRIAMESRSLIGIATGLVMAKYEVTEEQAFQYMARISQDTNTKLRAVAERIIEEVGPKS